MLDRAASHEPDGAHSFMGVGEPASESLGLVVNVQRTGDHLLTRRVFVTVEVMDDLPRFLPAWAWEIW